MSLYRFNNTRPLPPVASVPGLTIEESSDISMLAVMAGVSKETVEQRLANDHVAFVAFIHEVPASFGWMARGKAFVGELNHELVLPIGNRYLWNFRTLDNFRGMGIYPALLQNIIRYEHQQADSFWIIHAPENKSSLRGIRKAGFEFVGKLYSRNGSTTIESTPESLALHHQLREMDINILAKDPASCWNCSSPFLKVHKVECCCAQEGEVCVPIH